MEIVPTCYRMQSTGLCPLSLIPVFKILLLHIIEP